MNILLINHYAGSKRHGMEYRPYYMAREWQRLGHRVRIVAASHSHVRSVAPRASADLQREYIDGIEYVWIKTPPYHGNGAGRVFNMLAFVAGLYRHARELTEDLRPDAVIASSTYPLDVFPARRIARRAGAKLIFELHDLWPLSPMELGGMSRWHPFIAMMQVGENFACRNADALVSMLPKAEEHLRAHGLGPGKFHYVPNGIDVSEWTAMPDPLPDGIRARLDQLKRDGRFLVGYAGAHGLANALDYLIEAAKLTRDDPVTYVLVGQGPEKAGLQARAAGLGLSNVEFLPPVTKSQIPTLIGEMHAMFIGWRRKAIYRFGISPNKLMDYMMAGKPVIHSIEAGNDLVAESGCGVSVPPESPSAIADAVRHLAAMSAEQRRSMGARGRDFVVAHHDYRVLAGRFLDAMA
jgi:glycosyltransferase involved in cell wall biosynthesis